MKCLEWMAWFYKRCSLLENIVVNHKRRPFEHKLIFFVLYGKSVFHPFSHHLQRHSSQTAKKTKHISSSKALFQVESFQIRLNILIPNNETKWENTEAITNKTFSLYVYFLRSFSHSFSCSFGEQTENMQIWSNNNSH